MIRVHWMHAGKCHNELLTMKINVCQENIHLKKVKIFGRKKMHLSEHIQTFSCYYSPNNMVQQLFQSIHDCGRMCTGYMEIVYAIWCQWLDTYRFLCLRKAQKPVSTVHIFIWIWLKAQLPHLLLCEFGHALNSQNSFLVCEMDVIIYLIGFAVKI
jgi:hypothetical protein